MRATCSARSAAISSASVRGVGGAASGARRIWRNRDPTGVAPGSKVSRAARTSASARAWVDLPQPSMPSSAMRRPRAGISERFGRRSLLGAGGLLRRPALLGRGLLLGRRRLPGCLLLTRGGAGAPALAQQLGRALNVDRLHDVTLAQAGVGDAVGHVGAEAAVFDDDRQVGGRVGAQLAQ